MSSRALKRTLGHIKYHPRMGKIILPAHPPIMRRQETEGIREKPQGEGGGMILLSEGGGGGYRYSPLLLLDAQCRAFT
jgi:hypothetical protein